MQGQRSVYSFGVRKFMRRLYYYSFVDDDVASSKLTSLALHHVIRTLAHKK